MTVPRLKVLCLALPALVAGAAQAFSQGGGWYGAATPQGHEWLTVHSALEVLGDERPDDVRKHGKLWTHAHDLSVPASLVKHLKAQASSDEKYRAKYAAVVGAVYGQRWVDLAGFSLLKNMFVPSTKTTEDCWFGVAQDPDQVQHDHFLRQSDEAGGDGAVRALHDANARFRRYFIEAAMAGHHDGEKLRAWDGGIEKTEIVNDRNFFLFGRALHLFQDSFSPEHAVRTAADGYKKVHGIKTFVCTKGAESHTLLSPSAASLAKSDVAELYGKDGPIDGDIIFRDAGTTHTARGLTDAALVALESSKDLWAAFLRTMAVPRNARAAAAAKEADALIAWWLSSDAAAVKARYATLRVAKAACDKDPAAIKTRLRKCLYNIVPKDGSEVDKALHLPFFWERRHALYFETPPANWKAF